MRWIDIISSSLNNLFRRKLRSALTMLGVVIGTTAIIVTISLGYGAEATQISAMESMSNLRLLQVYPYYGGMSPTEDGSGRRISKITDSVLRQIRTVKGVDAVTPMVYIWMNSEMTTGKFVSNPSLVAVSPRDFAKIQGLKEGQGFSGRTDRMEFIMSEIEMLNFIDPKKENEWVNYWEYIDAGLDLPLPDIKWLRANYTYTVKFEDYENVDEATGEPEVTTLDTKAQMRGVIGASNDYTFSYGAIVNIDWYRKFYKDNQKLFKQMQIEPIESYDQVYVLAKTTDDVQQVMNDLREIGLEVSSPLDWIQQMREQIQTMQVFMGFIGAISMFVAALSIANTMMMSIYERTREIGVMKVLGCRLGNIRMMFLTEAAFIGIFGGMIGVLASYGLSYALNNVESLQQLVGSVMSSVSYMSEGGTTSIIPAQLSLSTWGFVALISIVSGFYPAQRAMQLSSLAAIRSAD